MYIKSTLKFLNPTISSASGVHISDEFSIISSDGAFNENKHNLKSGHTSRIILEPLKPALDRGANHLNLALGVCAN